MSSALAFLAFAAHIGAGWRGGPRATVLLATQAFSAVWAGLNLGFALTLRPGFWIGETVVDALRIDGWLLFMVFRRVHHQSRWSIKPLCLGLGGGFVEAAALLRAGL